MLENVSVHLKMVPAQAAGPHGLASQHLKNLISEPLGETSQRLVEALVKFTNRIVLCENLPAPAVNYGMEMHH